MQLENSRSFFSLVRLGVGHEGGLIAPNVNWTIIEDLAERHGLFGILVDGVERIRREDQRPPKEMLLQWIGTVLQDYEYRYEQYCKAIAELAAFYNSHGFKMMVLKGYACSLNWPKPEHRPCGDIDIWQFGRQTEADILLSKEKGIKIDYSHHHHSVFYWHDFMVENHYDFINIHSHSSNKLVEKQLKELGKDDAHRVDVLREKVYLPSPNLNALFLLRHTMAHFAATELTLRQLLDWAFFVKKHTNEVDWNWLKSLLKDLGALNLFNVFNAICVEDLGFESSIFPKVQFDPFLKERVLYEILYPEISNIKPRNVFKRVIWKVKRWKVNRWKNELVYRESMWSSFWRGVWSHILKPSSI